jgi:flagellar basal body-associated protein FliL
MADILEPPKKKKSKALWIVIAVLLVLFILFQLVDFTKLFG